MSNTFDFRDYLGKRKRRAFRRYAPIILTGLLIGGGLGVGMIQLQNGGATPASVEPKSGDEVQALLDQTVPTAPVEHRARPISRPQPLIETQPVAVEVISPTQFACTNPRVVDGDTIRCGGERVRLAHIDAPELPGHCNPGRACTPGDPFASTDNLSKLMAGSDVQCRGINIDRYGRTVALCRANGRDLSCAQYQGGFAVERYGALSC